MYSFFRLLQEFNEEKSNATNRTTPISIDSKLSLADDKNSQPAAIPTVQSDIPMYSNVSTYVTEKRPLLSHTENVSQYLEIIDELSKKIRPVEQDDEVRVFGEFVAIQLKQIKTKSCRGKCVHGIQRILMDWQNKDEEFINQLVPQQEWQIQEENDVSINKTVMVDLSDVNNAAIVVNAADANAIDPLDGELASLGFDA